MPDTSDSAMRASQERLRQADDLLRHHFATGDPVALDRAIPLYRGYLASAPASDAGRRAGVSNLLAALAIRCTGSTRSPDRADVAELIALGTAAAASRAAGAQDVRILGTAYEYRHQLDGRPEDLDASIEAFRRAAAFPPGAVADPSATFNSLGLALDRRHRLTGEAADLSDAENAYRAALRLVPPGGTEATGITSNLAATRYQAFLVHGDTAALREALGLLRACLPAVAVGSPARPAVLGNLAACLRQWVSFTMDPADFEELVEVSRQALDAVPEGHPNHVERLAGLGVSLRLAAEGIGDPAPLRESVGLLREALRRTAPDTAAYHDRSNSLGNALHRLAEWTGDPALLDEAIGHLRRTVAGWRPGVFGRTSGLGNLAVALRRRHQQTGDLEALREAADLARQAIRAGAADHQEHAAMLSNLGVVLQSWYETTGERATAAEAVDIAREALALLPPGSSLRADRLNVLANALRTDFDIDGDQDRLREAVALLEEAVEQTPYGDPVLATVLSNLGSAWLTTHQATGDPQALDQAVIALGRAVWATSGEDATRGVHLMGYADALADVYGLQGDPTVLEAAQDAYREAAVIDAMPAYRRVLAAWQWGAAAAEGERWQEALEGYELAVELLPLAASGRLTRRDQEQGLAQAHGLAAEAAACAMNAGRPERAIVLLEQGRGVLLGRTMAVRDEFVRLGAEHPGVAERYTLLRERIEALESAGDPMFAAARAPAGPATDLRHELADEWERLVAGIRTLPGFADFLAAPSAESLLACAQDGPVVLAYCCDYRSDALVLHEGRIIRVALPGATPQEVERQVERLDEALVAAVDPATEEQAQQTVAEVLVWTWKHVTEPVLDRLGFRGPPPDGGWPRLWWSPGGALACLPLHAAGHHDPQPLPEPRAVLDRVVSSYTPTVRALAYARRRAAGPAPGGGLLAVALPDTPGAPPLSGVAREVRALERLLPAPRVLAGPLATFAHVLAALPDHPYAHFACHGVGDPDDPSDARLLVYDHDVRPLTVREISRLDLTAARLAVLSACDTSRGARWLADEAVHITSAFQIAGYPQAIGTLWPVHDAIAVRVTRSLYGTLRAGLPATSQELDTDRAAEALHHAVRDCRAAFRRAPSLWAAHVHAGA